MPELPEVEVLKLSLSRLILNSRITKVEINNRNLRYKLPNNFSRALQGNILKKIKRRAKYVIFVFAKKYSLLIHLGMSGVIFLIRKKDEKKIKTSFYYDLSVIKKHNHILIYFDNKYILVYNDIRRFGFFKLFKKQKLDKNKFLAKLGPEPLSNLFNYKYFSDFIFNRKKNIKKLFMDQTFVSGLGNIYVNEILFYSKISPFKSSHLLSKKQIQKLISNTKKILKNAIIMGGSSIKDYKNVSGKIGKYQENFKVYNREGQKCLRKDCSLGMIQKKIIANRASFYCNKCQK